MRGLLVLRDKVVTLRNCQHSPVEVTESDRIRIEHVTPMIQKWKYGKEEVREDGREDREERGRQEKQEEKVNIKDNGVNKLYLFRGIGLHEMGIFSCLKIVRQEEEFLS